MKKIILSILLIISLNSFSQNLDTVSVSLTLRAQDWAWFVGKYGAGMDSADRVSIRALRAAMIAANPPAWTTNVQINGVKGRHLIAMYSAFMNSGFGEVLNMGTNTAERTTIYTTIRAVNNSAVQYFIGVIDANFSNEYINNRKRGKEILLDN